jgi:hypothetical protein
MTIAVVPKGKVDAETTMDWSFSRAPKFSLVALKFEAVFHGRPVSVPQS